LRSTILSLLFLPFSVCFLSFSHLLKCNSERAAGYK